MMVSDFGKVAKEYAAYRPNYLDQIFDLLALKGVVSEGNRVLDLATGSGLKAYPVVPGSHYM